MELKEAKEYLNSKGYRLIDESNDNYDNETIELLKSEELQKLARESQKFTFEGKTAFPLERFGEVFSGYNYGFMLRIQLPNSTDTGTFIEAHSAHTIHYMRTINVEDGWHGSSMGYFYHIIQTLEQLKLLPKWTKMFRSEKIYPLDTFIPFLKDLLKVWDEDFFKIVEKFADDADAKAIADDIANYKGSNWSGD